MATMQINWRSGQSIIKKGTPIDVDGNIANNSDAVALVASDTVAPLDAEVITSGTFDEEKYYCGFTISDDCKRALSEINFIGTDGEQHPATSLPTPKSDDAGKTAVVNEQGNAYALGAGGGGGLSLVSGGGINITWDGSTEGRDSFEMMGMSEYKVADGFLSVDELTGCDVALNDSTAYTLDEELISVIVPNKLISCDGLVMSCVAGTYDLPISPSEIVTVTVPSDGVYFGASEYHGEVLRPTSIIKSAPSKLMQNGEDVTQEVAKTVGGMFVIHVTDDDNGNYVADKTYDEIREAYSSGLIPVCIMVSNSEIFYLSDADGRFAFGITFCGGNEDTEELIEITHELVTISEIDGETEVKFYSYYHIF